LNGRAYLETLAHEPLHTDCSEAGATGTSEMHGRVTQLSGEMATVIK
jgi:hypothetical protein